MLGYSSLSDSEEVDSIARKSVGARLLAGPTLVGFRLRSIRSSARSVAPR